MAAQLRGARGGARRAGSYEMDADDWVWFLEFDEVPAAQQEDRAAYAGGSSPRLSGSASGTRSGVAGWMISRHW